jgi:D-glycero-alpha-D-manno-heptose-7-phosphate kinase
MIIAKTPYRISFFGGGTDFPEWYKNNKGKIISTSINYFSYIQIKNLPDIFDYKYRLRYFLREEVNRIADIKHPVIREALKYFKHNKQGLDIIHSGDLVARSGIGSSSSFTVGFLHAFCEYKNIKISKRKLADLAIKFEQIILKEHVGSQDQIIAAYGGFQIINFKNKKFNCTKLKLKKKKIKLLESSVQLFYTGIQRSAQILEKKKILSVYKKQKYYNKIYNIACEAEKIFLSNNNKNFISKIGNLLNLQWTVKKNLAKGVTNDSIDRVYNLALKNGAIGGKLCGAGGGGFLLFVTPKRYQKKVSKYVNLPEVLVKFGEEGSKIIFNHNKK